MRVLFRVILILTFTFLSVLAPIVFSNDVSVELDRRISSEDMSVSNVRRIQELLTNAGYKPGPVDGIPGRKTRRAVQQYAKSYSKNLPNSWAVPKRESCRYYPGSMGMPGGRAPESWFRGPAIIAPNGCFSEFDGKSFVAKCGGKPVCR